MEFHQQICWGTGRIAYLNKFPLCYIYKRKQKLKNCNAWYKKYIHLYQNPPSLGSTMKTIFPDKSWSYDQINLKTMIDYVEMDIKAHIL